MAQSSSIQQRTEQSTAHRAVNALPPCPRCNGLVQFNSDAYGAFSRCIICGWYTDWLYGERAPAQIWFYRSAPDTRTVTHSLRISYHVPKDSRYPYAICTEIAGGIPIQEARDASRLWSLIAQAFMADTGLHLVRFTPEPDSRRIRERR